MAGFATPRRSHMKQSLLLKYQKEYFIAINDSEQSLYYYFDYDERSRKINMEFQHSHVFHEIMIVLSPGVAHLIEGVPYDLEEGDIVLIPPTILHKSIYPAGAPSKRLVIGFLFPEHLFHMPEHYQPLLSIFRTDRPVLRFPSDIREEIFSILDTIYTLSLSQDYQTHPVDQLMIHSLFVQFLYKLMKNEKNNIYSQEAFGHNSDRKIYEINSYIHKHYSEDLSLISLAEKFYLSPSHLSHQFKKVNGFTLINYIQQTRVSNAKNMLLFSDLPISVIAHKCGFQSFSQFNRSFRQICGCSPSAMRASGKLQGYINTAPTSSSSDNLH